MWSSYFALSTISLIISSTCRAACVFCLLFVFIYFYLLVFGFRFRFFFYREPFVDNIVRNCANWHNYLLGASICIFNLINLQFKRVCMCVYMVRYRIYLSSLFICLRISYFKWLV